MTEQIEQAGTPKARLDLRIVVLLVVLVPTTMLCGVRTMHFESSQAIILLETFTPLVLLPAYPGLIAACWWRMRVFVVWALVIIACHVTWIAPELDRAESLPDNIESSRNFTVYSHNILGGKNTTIDQEIKAIVAANADFVTLQEMSRSIMNRIDESEMTTIYPHVATTVRGDDGGVTTYSKYRIKNSRGVREGKSRSLRSTIVVDDRDLTLYNVHTPSPAFVSAQQWLDGLEELRIELHGHKGPVIAAGDFNSTWYHRPFRELLENGYRDAHMDRGRGWIRTWPVNIKSAEKFGGVIRIDHILTSREMRATSASEGDGNGSDHRAIKATVAYVPTN